MSVNDSKIGQAGSLLACGFIHEWQRGGRGFPSCRSLGRTDRVAVSDGLSMTAAGPSLAMILFSFGLQLQMQS